VDILRGLQGSTGAISGEQLELMGKQAAANWEHGQHRDLTTAVLAVIKEANLSREQILRVVEQTNLAAYHAAFRKEGSAHKVIEFPGGPADPHTVMKKIAKQNGRRTVEAGLNDYAMPPGTKTASVTSEAFARMLFPTSEEKKSVKEATADAMHLLTNISGAADSLSAQAGHVELLRDSRLSEFYSEVKQAAMDGTTLGQVVAAISQLNPHDASVKTAFAYTAQRLQREGVFQSVEDIEDSLQKTASVGLVNMQHPLVQSFAAYESTLNKLAELRAALQVTTQQESQLRRFLQENV